MESFFKNNMNKDMTVEDLERKIQDVPGDINPKFAGLFGEITKEELMYAISNAGYNENLKSKNHLPQNDDKTLILATLVQERLCRAFEGAGVGLSRDDSFMMGVGVSAHNLPLKDAVDLLYAGPNLLNEVYYRNPEKLTEDDPKLNPKILFTNSMDTAYQQNKNEILKDIKGELKTYVRINRLKRGITPEYFGPIQESEMRISLIDAEKNFTPLQRKVFLNYVEEKKWTPAKTSKELAKEINAETVRQNKTLQKQWVKEYKEMVKSEKRKSGGWER